MLDSSDIQEIEKTAVTVLDNNYTTITVEKKKIVLAGLTFAYVPDYRKATNAIRSETNRVTPRKSA